MSPPTQSPLSHVTQYDALFINSPEKPSGDAKPPWVIVHFIELYLFFKT